MDQPWGRAVRSPTLRRKDGSEHKSSLCHAREGEALEGILTDNDLEWWSGEMD
jgi:hypothetical protein